MKTYDELFALITQRGVHAVFGEYGEGWGIEQNADELAHFLVEMQKLGVTSILEVGTGWKAGLARFLRDDMGWRVTSVDIKSYGHDFGGIDFVHPNDFDYNAVDEAYDLVLLDADHTYDGVKDQHEFYAQYATKVVAFHDIAGLRDCEGVRDYWQELSGGVSRAASVDIHAIRTKAKPGYHEIIANSDQRGGIGYIVLAEADGNSVEHIEATDELIRKSATKHAELLEKLKDDNPPAKPKPPAKKPAARKPAAKKPAAKTTAKK